MIDHFNLPVADLDRSVKFYNEVLTLLGMPKLIQDDDAVGFGLENWEFGVVAESARFVPIHLAFRAGSHDQVRHCYNIALKAGAKCNGEPGLREIYGPGYFAAYVIDFDGHNLEFVCR